MKHVNFRGRYSFLGKIKSVNLPGFRWISHRLPAWIIPAPQSEVVVKTIYDFDILVNPVLDKGLENYIYYNGTYEAGTLELIAEFLKPGQSFLDIGANIGLMTLYASKIVGKNGQVYSVEANPETAKILNTNIQRNQFANIKLIPHAVGAEKGKGKIYANIHLNRGSASLVNHENTDSYYEIDIFPLYDLISPDTHIHLVKMDIEGYELEALRGMKNLLSKENSPVLIIECGEAITGTEYSKESVYNFINSTGNYRFFKLKNGKGKISLLTEIYSVSDLPSHDNMICIPVNQTENYRYLYSEG